MEIDIKALETNNTLEIVDLHDNKILIDCKWVYKIKSKADG